MIINDLVIEGPKGFGDAVYLRVIAAYMSNRFSILTKYPEVFEGVLPAKNIFTYKDNINLFTTKVTYYPGRVRTDTNQFQDMCNCLSIGNIPFKIKPEPQPCCDISFIKKPKVIINHPLYGIRPESKYKEMIPDVKIFQDIVNIYKNHIFTIATGDLPHNNILDGIDMDLCGATSFKELLWIVKQADLVVTRPGHLLPIAEAVGTNCLCIFGAKQLASKDPEFNRMTPEKMITNHKFVRPVIDKDFNKECLNI